MIDDDICVAKEAFSKLKSQEPRGSTYLKSYLVIAIWNFEC